MRKVTMALWSLCIACGSLAAASANDAPVSALDALPQRVRVSCRAVEIDLTRIPAELADEISPESGQLKVFRDERNADLPFVRAAGAQDVERLLERLVRCGAVTIRAEPTIVTNEGQSAEIQIVRRVSAANSPIGLEFCHTACTFAAKTRRFPGGWLIEMKLQLLEPDFDSNEVALSPPLVALPGRNPPKSLPTMLSSSVQTILGVCDGTIIPCGGLVTSRSTSDGEETQRICQLVLLSAESVGMAIPVANDEAAEAVLHEGK
jgi:hypothetical protein